MSEKYVKRPLLVGSTSVVYEKGSSKIYSNPFSVTIESTSIKSEEDLQEFAAILSLAWKERLKLKGKATAIQ